MLVPFLLHSPVQSFVEVIQLLPDMDKPSFFGLPANIERSAQRTVSAQVIAQDMQW